jgi:transposase-like protein
VEQHSDVPVVVFHRRQINRTGLTPSNLLLHCAAAASPDWVPGARHETRLGGRQTVSCRLYPSRGPPPLPCPVLLARPVLLTTKCPVLLTTAVRFCSHRDTLNCHCCSAPTKKFGKFRNVNRIVQRYRCTRCGKTFSEDQPLEGVRIEQSKAAQIVHLLCEGVGVRAAAKNHRCRPKHGLKRSGDGWRALCAIAGL